MLTKKLLIIPIMMFSLLMASQSLASTSDGTINGTYRYAWGENVGWVDFGSTAGNVHITDEGLSGYAYGENIGWINLANVINDKEGNLSGYAWGENVGFIDFSQVEIDNDGYFTGQAYGENVGWITFNKDDTNNVMTDWRPESSRSSHTSSGSYVSGSYFTQPQQEQQTPNPSDGLAEPDPACLPGYLYSPTTGIACLDSTQINNLNIERTLKLTIPMMRGDDIKSLQVYLNIHGYNPGISDGIFGSKTKQAVINFQKANNLVPDGIVGPLTQAKLK